MALAKGFPCPRCGDERDKDIVHFFADDRFNVRCPKCETVYLVDQREQVECLCCLGKGELEIRVYRVRGNTVHKFEFETECGVCDGSGTVVSGGE